MLGEIELAFALANNSDVQVMHASDYDGEHRWSLKDREKEELRASRARGLTLKAEDSTIV